MPTKNTTRRNSTTERAERGPNPPPGAAAQRLQLVVQYATTARGLPTRAKLRRWARAALLAPAAVTLRIVGRREARALNRRYRRRDYPTNVLTFAYPGGHRAAADIVLCAPVVAHEAAEQRKRLEAHFAHLVVHGVLHMQGHDHRRAGEARAMEALETRILAGLGYADPYV